MKNEKLNQPPIRKFEGDNIPEQFEGYIQFNKPNGTPHYRHKKWNDVTKKCVNSVQYLLDEGFIEREENKWIGVS